MKKRRKHLGGLGMEHLVCTGAEPTALVKVRLTRDGYDAQSGRYFGVGEQLWSYGNSQSYGHLRASTRAAAKAKLKAKCPIIRFLR